MAQLKEYVAHSSPWPDPMRGPLVLTYHFALVHGLPRCVGLDIRSFREKRLSGPQDASSLWTLPGAEATPITASLVRQLPVGALIDEATEAEKDLLKAAAAGAQGFNPDSLRRTRELSTVFGDPGARRTGTLRWWTRERLETVRDTYLEARTLRRPPTRAVQERFHVSHSMAAKLVARCRSEGLLEKTSQGRPGDPKPKRGRRH